MLQLARAIHRGGVEAAALGSVLFGCVVALADADRQGQNALRHVTRADLANCERSNEVITEPVARELEREGFVVVDGVLSAKQLQAVQAELRGQAHKDRFCASQNEKDGDHVDGKAVRTDAICFLSNREKGELDVALLHVSDVLRGVGHALGKRHFKGFDPSAAPPFLAVPDEMQLSVYESHGSYYRCHRDSPPRQWWKMNLMAWLATKSYRLRSLTAILYLNEDPAWSSPQDGGALKLFIGAHEDDLDGTTATRVLEIEPLGGRLILFDSASMLHAVLPSHRTRTACTLWFVDVDLPQAGL